MNTDRLKSFATKRNIAIAACFAVACTALVCRRSSERARGFTSLAQQGSLVQTSFAGTIDPTAVQFAGGMVASSSSTPSSTIMDQNRAALLAAATWAAARNYEIYIPPTEPGSRYPFNCSSNVAVDLTGLSNIHITGYGATLSLSGSMGSAACDLLRVRNSSNTVIQGVTFSSPNATSPTSNVNLVKIGDGGSTTVTDVKLIDCSFVEGVASSGDYVRLDGGSSAVTVQRVTIERTRFETAPRSAINVRAGVQQLTVRLDWFVGSVNRDIWMESPGDNTVGQFLITLNTFDRTGSTNAVAVTLSGNSGTNNAERSAVRYNHFVNGVIEGTHLGQTHIEANDITYDVARGSTALVDLSGKIVDVWVTDNYLYRGVNATAGAVIKTSVSGSAPTNVTIRGNRVLQYTGISPGIDVSGTSRATIVENNITYNAATADSGATGFSGIYCAGATNVCSGVIEANSIRQDFLTDGSTTAGRPLAGITLLKGSGTTIGNFQIRDNHVDAAKDIIYSDADGSTEWPSGYPVVSGNFGVGTTNEFEGGITTWRNETTQTTETRSSGALLVNYSVSFLTTANTVAYTLGPASVDGWVHCIKIKSVTGTPAGTLTPATLADGTTHTITWSAAGGYACMVWDAASSLYRLRGSTGVTIN